MSWDEHHSRSERLASQGEHVARAGDRAAAEKLYAQAAEAEVAALDGLAPEKLRTRGITSVSAVALWYKAHELSRAEQLAYRSLAGGDLPEFAQAQIRELLTLIWTTRSAEAVLAYPLPAAPPGCRQCGDVTEQGRQYCTACAILPPFPPRSAVTDTPQGDYRALLQQTAAALWDMQHEPDCWCAYSGGSGPTGHTEACAQARVVNEKLKAAGVQHWHAAPAAPPQEDQ